MEAKTEIRGEILSVFDGGVSEKATGYRRYKKIALTVGLVVAFGLYCYFTVDYLLEGKILALFLGVFLIGIYWAMAVPREKQLVCEENRKVIIYEDGVAVTDLDGGIVFSEAYEKMMNPTVKTLIDCYRLELQNRYGMKVFIAMKSLNDCWTVSEAIENTAEKNGIELRCKK